MVRFIAVTARTILYEGEKYNATSGTVRQGVTQSCKVISSRGVNSNILRRMFHSKDAGLE